MKIVYNFFMAALIFVAIPLLAKTEAKSVARAAHRSFKFDRKKSHKSTPNFRKATDQLLSSNTLSTQGLKNLRASASGQLSYEELYALKNKLGVKKLILIDLRQEPHALICGQPVHWKHKIIIDNPHKIIALEKKFITMAKKTHITAERTTPNYVQDFVMESDLAHSLGITSLRLPIQAGKIPSDPIIEKLVQIFDSIDDQTWIHFHCRQGNGRATTAIICYDIFCNAHKVSYDDILKRHHALGGVEIAKRSKYAVHNQFLKKFYGYAKGRKQNPHLSWTAYKPLS